jgi:hypothetical protein
MGMWREQRTFVAPAGCCNATFRNGGLLMKRRSSANPWATVARDAARVAAHANGVIALRLAMLARGGATSQKEARRMVTEKAEALVQAQFAAAKSIASGKKPPAVMRETISIYGRCVRSNRRRLTGQWWRWWW